LEYLIQFDVLNGPVNRSGIIDVFGKESGKLVLRKCNARGVMQERQFVDIYSISSSELIYLVISTPVSIICAREFSTDVQPKLSYVPHFLLSKTYIFDKKPEGKNSWRSAQYTSIDSPHPSTT